MTKRREAKPGRFAGRMLAFAALLLLCVPGGVRAEDEPSAAPATEREAEFEAARAGLRSAQASARLRAVNDLQRLGPLASAAAAELIEALDDDDSHVRDAAFDAIPALGAPTATTEAELAARANRADPRYAALALWASIASGRRSGAQLRSALLDPATREAARSALALRGAQARDVWVALAHDDAWRLRVLGLRGLAALGAAAGDRIDVIVAHLDDPIDAVRSAAFAALATLIPVDARAVGPALERLEGPRLPASSRFDLLGALTHRLPSAEVESRLRTHLLADDPFEKLASRALFAAGARDERVLDSLARGAWGFPPWSPNRDLQDLRPKAAPGVPLGFRMNLVEALRGLGPVGVAAVVRATPLEGNRRVAVLGLLATDEAWEALEALCDNPEARVPAAWVLVFLRGPKTPQHAVDIAFATYAPWPFDPSVRPWWNWEGDDESWGGRLAATVSPRLPALWLECWDRATADGPIPDADPSGGAGVLAPLAVLARVMGDSARPIVAGLSVRLSSERLSVRKAARESLAALGPVAASAAPAIEAVLARTPDAAEAAALRQVLDAMRTAIPK